MILHRLLHNPKFYTGNIKLFTELAPRLIEMRLVIYDTMWFNFIPSMEK